MDNKTCTELYPMETARIYVLSNLQNEIQMFEKSDNCWKCAYSKVDKIKANISNYYDFNSNFGKSILFGYLPESKNNTICKLDISLNDHGIYKIVVNNYNCSFYSICPQPANNNIRKLAVFVLISTILILLVLWNCISYIYRKGYLNFLFSFFYPSERSITNTDINAPIINDDTSAENVVLGSIDKGRVKCIDTFRGIAIVLMIFVNYGGGGYWYFQHAAWDGLTVADLVFPWFVFIMGTSMAFSFRSSLRHGVGRWSLLFKSLRRSALLFFLGLVLSNQNCHDISHLRIMGVLQRLSLTYLFVASLEAANAVPADNHPRKWWSFMRDIIPFWKIWMATFILVTIHSLLTFLLPVPGCPSGYLGPGGIQVINNSYSLTYIYESLTNKTDFIYENCTGGTVGYVDRMILGNNHQYNNPTCKNTYKTKIAFDPEGLFATLTCIFTCILGLQAGRILLTYQYWVRRIKRWIGWAIVLGFIAGFLCGFKQFGGMIPINKNLWSLSYVFATASLAFLLLFLLYISIDVYSIWNGTPFSYLGINSLAIYICSEVFEHYFPLSFQTKNDHISILLMNVWGCIFWITASWLLHRKNIFIKFEFICWNSV